MTTTDSPARLTLGMATASALAAALPGSLLGLRATPDLLTLGLSNPDSAMRLVRLHDILAAGRPLHAVMRDGSGAGTLLHWSHLLDSLLLLLAAPVAALVGWDPALHLAGLLVGPLGLAALGVAAAWAALPCAGRGWAWLAAVAIGASPALEGYGMTGVVHHHVLLALAAVMTGGWALRILTGHAQQAGGVALGAWAAAGLWLSPESLPFSLMALGALWVAWFAAPAVRLGTALLAASVTFALVSTLAWAVDPPAAGWLAVEPDRLSLPLVLLTLGAATAAAAARLSPRRVPTLLCGGGAAMAWLLAYPQVLRGTEALLPPDQLAAMFGRITEMQPVGTLPEAVEALLGGLFATGALGALALRRRSLVLLYAAGCAAVLLVLASSHVRFAPYPAAAGAVLLPVVLAAISRSAAAPALQSFARVAILLPILLVPLLAPLTATASSSARVQCPIAGGAALLADHPDAVVLADVNLTPDLLYRTRVRTVGSLYHRSPAGFMRLRAAWRSIPDEGAPPPALLATAASLVLACPGAPRSALVEDLPNTTLADRLADSRPPPWLQRVADAGPGGFVLYRVAP